ncbi:hypothetical protein S83_034942 [Arachis hypogaea]
MKLNSGENSNSHFIPIYKSNLLCFVFPPTLPTSGSSLGLAPLLLLPPPSRFRNNLWSARISLPYHGTVQVRSASNVAHASLVTIEPHTEDDWEVLELNSEQAEAAILNQIFVIVVHSLLQHGIVEDLD